MKKFGPSLGAFTTAILLSLGLVVSCRDSATAPGGAMSPPISRSASVTAAASVAFVQAKATSVAAQTAAVPFNASTGAGNLVVVSFDYTGTTFSSITDSQGSVFTQVGSEITSPGGAKSRMYYARNIPGGAETITVNLAGSAPFLEVYAAEYSGADTLSPLDGSAQNTGPAGSVSSGNIVTATDNDMLVAYCVGDTFCSAGSGFAPRSTLNSNLLEDRTVGAAGSYAATGSAGGGWGIIAAAFKPQIVATLPTPVDTVTVSPSTASVLVGGTQSLTATTKDASGNVLAGRAVTWTTSDPSIATVDAAGVVTGAANGGPVTITATSEGKVGTASITVTLVPVNSVTVTPPTSSIAVGSTVPLTATLKDANNNVLTGRAIVWTSSNASLATVSAAGVVTAVAAGTATITATAEGKSGSATVTVVSVTTSVTFVQAKASSSSSNSLSVPFSAATSAGDLVVVSFDYEGTTVNSITDSQGNTFAQVGSEVTSPGGAKARMYYAKNIKGGAETVTINVTGTAAGLEVYLAEYKGADLTSPLDGSAQSSGSSSSVNSGNLVTSAASDMLVAFSVCDNACQAGSGFSARSNFHSNLLEDRKVGAAGSYAATASANAGWGITAAAFKPQGSGITPPPPPPAPVASVVVTPTNSTATIGFPAPLSATVKDAAGNVLTGRVIAWSSSNTSIATVNGTGVVTGVAAGTATITATSEGQSGAATVSVTSPAMAGPLHVSALNPRYFTDATGKAILLSGSHTWLDFQDAGPGDPPPTFDYTAYLNFLTTHHHNFTELWRWEQTKFNSETSTIYTYAPAPYVRTGPGNAIDGKLKFDLSQFDPAYFDRMRQRVIEAGQRGIYVSIMLFNGWSISNKGHLNNPWLGHPFNKTNNVNGIDGDPDGNNSGDETQTLQLPAVSALQDAYVRRVIDAVNDLDNVLYEVSNEPTGSTANVAWQQHIIDVVKQYEGTLAKQHPVGMTALFPGGNDSDLFASTADFISPAAPGTISDTPAATGAKVILHDTDHICGICGSGAWVWKSFTRGVNPVLMDVYDGAYAVLGNPNPNDPAIEETRVNMGYVLSYASRINLAAMPPHGELTSTGYALAHPVAQGAEYLVYAPAGGTFTVNLSAASGTLTLEWFNANTGVASSGGTTTGGATRTFTAPTGATVLYLH